MFQIILTYPEYPESIETKFAKKKHFAMVTEQLVPNKRLFILSKNFTLE